MRNSVTYWCSTAGFLLLTASQSAYAYLDPGTGSILLQSLLAGIAVAIGVVRMYWYRVKSFFGATSQSSEDPIAEAEESPQDSSSGG